MPLPGTRGIKAHIKYKVTGFLNTRAQISECILSDIVPINNAMISELVRERT
jgi:hypothetical protein